MSNSDSDTFGVSSLVMSDSNEASSSLQNTAVEKHQSEMSIIDGKFFRYLPEKSSSDAIVALCVKCQPRNVEIKGYKNTTSNFISHLKRRHGEQTVEDYQDYNKSKRIKISSAGLTNETASHSSRGHAQKLSQHTFDKCIAKFLHILHIMIPLRTVENPYFISLFDKLNIFKQGLTRMSRRSLGNRINSLFETQNLLIKQELQEIPFVCTTADIWSGKKRSFLGVTAHFI